VRPEWVYASHLTGEPDLVASFLLLPSTQMPLHAVGWTLIHEFWFYLVFGLLLVLPRQALGLALGGWAAAVVAGALLLPDPASPWLDLARHPLTLEFLAGAGAGLLAARGWFPAPLVMVRVGLVLLVFGLFAGGSEAGRLFAGEWWRVLVFALPCTLLVWGLVGLERQGFWRAPGALVRLGDWSYALYLLHVPVFAAVGRMIAPVSGPSLLDSAVFLPLALGLAIAVSAAAHRLYERPLIRLAARARPLLASGAVLAALSRRPV
jgi:exopolysaccharide production protein ExoZ